MASRHHWSSSMSLEDFKVPVFVYDLPTSADAIEAAR
jgi:hypothetical protein